jgi:LCP family protein required for cell wall assembly
MTTTSTPRPEREDPFGPLASSAHPPEHPRRGRRLRRVMIGLLVAVLVLGGAGAGAAFWWQHRLDSNIERFPDPTRSIPESKRAVRTAPKALNLLLLGSDSRISAGDPSAWVRGAQRTDAIMIAHVPTDRSGVTITSIPRDSWVDVPGHGKNKINAGFSFGGPSLMVQTVEGYTGVRIDHVVIVDFEGFTTITDKLGGVDITVPQATADESGSFRAGSQRMDGKTALRYVRQRHNLPGGDFDRVKRQQNWIRAVTAKTLARGTLTSPLKLNGVLNALTKAIATDDGFSAGQMRSLALSLRQVRGGDLTFLTAPVAGTGRSPDGKQSIVLLDRTANRALWKAVRDDTLSGWLAANPDAVLGRSVR